METFIDNKPISQDLITYNNGLNFNRFFEDTIIKEYKIKLPKNQFIASLEQEYNNVRDEIKIDDETNKETSDFKETGYCSFIELPEKPKYLFEIFDWYLRHHFFYRYIENKDARYVINSVDAIKVGDTIEITGKAFQKK